MCFGYKPHGVSFWIMVSSYSNFCSEFNFVIVEKFLHMLIAVFCIKICNHTVS